MNEIKSRLLTTPFHHITTPFHHIQRRCQENVKNKQADR